MLRHGGRRAGPTDISVPADVPYRRQIEPGGRIRVFLWLEAAREMRAHDSRRSDVEEIRRLGAFFG